MVLDCLNGQITHPDPVVFKASGRAARVQCKVDSSTLRSSVIHWYRAPPKGALQRLMYFEAGSPKATKDPDTPRRFSGSVSGDVVALTISKLEPSDEGSYYCALWSGDNTVLTIRGNHYKNLLLSTKRFYIGQQQQGGDFRHDLIVTLLLVINILLRNYV